MRSTLSLPPSKRLSWRYTDKWEHHFSIMEDINKELLVRRVRHNPIIYYIYKSELVESSLVLRFSSTELFFWSFLAFFKNTVKTMEWFLISCLRNKYTCNVIAIFICIISWRSFQSQKEYPPCVLVWEVRLPPYPSFNMG